MLELQAVNTELSRDLEQANLAIDICLPCVRAPPGAPVTLDKSMLALMTSVGKRPMCYPQLSAPPPLTIPQGPLPSALDTPTSQLTPVLSTPIGRPPLESSLQCHYIFPFDTSHFSQPSCPTASRIGSGRGDGLRAPARARVPAVKATTGSRSKFLLLLLQHR